MFNGVFTQQYSLDQGSLKHLNLRALLGDPCFIWMRKGFMCQVKPWWSFSFLDSSTAWTPHSPRSRQPLALNRSLFTLWYLKPSWPSFCSFCWSGSSTGSLRSATDCTTMATRKQTSTAPRSRPWETRQSGCLATSFPSMWPTNWRCCVGFLLGLSQRLARSKHT